MTHAPAARTFEVRYLQLARAAFAALAAVMITFSPDHSATVGLSVFSGFAVATGLVFGLAAWLVFPAGRRLPSILLAVFALAGGIVSAIGDWRTTEMFFAVVIVWALLSGAVEVASSWRRRDADAGTSVRRDGLTIGILTLVLAVALIVIPRDYALEYVIEEAPEPFTLTGITIAVGVFGGYAAIVAVYLGIAGLSPRARQTAAPATPVTEETS